jgi:beta-glucosidase-like glycosyl hydrolase
MTSDVPPEEMALLATGADYWSTHEVPELGLPRIRVSDGPHGLRVQDDDNPDHLGLGRSLPATCFPPAVTLASSWDPQLIRIVGAALAREARSLGVDVVLGPGIEIKRSPLCGRNFEYYSEDPLLTGRLAGAMVQGLQSQGVAACVKHFACNTQETDRLRVSADVDARALREIYLRAFELTIRDGNPWAVMSAYNRINGVFASENPWLLTDVLREEWGYDGVVISDWGAVHDPVAAVAAGLDLRMPGRPSDSRVRDALSNGTLDEAVVDRVAERLRLLASRTDESRKTRPIRTRADRPRTLRRRRGSASSVSSGLHAARRTLHKKRAQTPLRPAPKFQDASTPDPYCMFPLACSPWLRVAIAPDGSVTAVRGRVDPAHATALGRPRGRRSSDRSLAGVFRSLRNGLYGRGRCVRPPRSRWRAQSESGTRRSRCDAGRRSCGPIVGRAPASRSDRNQVIRAVIGPSSR